MLIDVVVDTREGFPDYKNVIFTKSKNLHISKGPMIEVKNRNFFLRQFFLK